jgi:hypothetical protein
MLFRSHVYPLLRDGSVRLAFRRWLKPAAKAGGRQRIPGGVLAIDAVEVVSPDHISDADAQLAGFESRQALLAELASQREGDIYRIDLHFAGPDSREELRERADLTPADVEEVRRGLTRLDATSRHGPWTASVLRVIAGHPEGTRAAALAAQLGREMLPFKADVRKLKELGLTESLGTGYRLSPRGKAFLTGFGTEVGGKSAEGRE